MEKAEETRKDNVKLTLGERLALELERLSILRRINTFTTITRAEQRKELETLQVQNLEIMKQLGYSEAERGLMLTEAENRNLGGLSKWAQNLKNF